MAFVILLAACQPQQSAVTEQRAQSEAVAVPKKFDFYVLALSWSPSYCEAEGASANRQQCSTKRRYAFVVHGLWPQFERGFPENCATDMDRVPEDMARSLYDIMPSLSLIGNEWRSHGSCTGLDQSAYFATLRAARARVAIPQPYKQLGNQQTVSADEVERAFMDANPGLPSNAIAVSCVKRLLREVRICMTSELAFRPCPELEKGSCRAKSLVMPPVRR